MSLAILPDKDVKISEDLEKDHMPQAPSEYKEWPEYRDYIRKYRCVICTATEGKDREGNDIEDGQEYVPELVRVSDPHHVTSRGAGGPDAENLAPLCRFHHTELHSLGRITFELKYNFDLKGAANILFNRFVDGFREDEFQSKIRAQHQLILSRMHMAREGYYHLGKMLSEFQSKRYNGKKGWAHLGFENFESYISAPISSGGLGVPVRSAWRYLAYSRGHDKYSVDGASLLHVDMTKAQVILPLLKKAESEEERGEIINAAKNMTTSDLVSWKNNKEGIEDPKNKVHQEISMYLDEIFDTFGIPRPDEESKSSIAWRFYNIAHRNDEFGAPINPTKGKISSTRFASKV